MFSLSRRKTNATATEVLKVEQIPVTIPTRVQPQATVNDTELAEYVKLAERVKFRPPVLLQHQLVQFLRGNSIDVYPMKSVEAYLDYKFGKPKKNRDFSYPPFLQTWGWHPLREEDCNKITNGKSGNENGHIQSNNTYSKIIPPPVLETIDLISTHFAGSKPGVLFFVADAVVPHQERDPFLAVTAGLEFLVIERWDEPPFRS